MAKTIGKNVNSTDVAVSSTISVGSSVAVTLLPALTSGDIDYIEILVTNNGNRGLRVRRRPAASDNLKDSRRVSPGETAKIVRDSDVYSGEISAIFESGGFNDVDVEFI